MILWVAVVSVLTLHNGKPVEFSYPLATPYVTERECREAAIEETNVFLSSALENSLEITDYAAYCFQFPNKGII